MLLHELLQCVQKLIYCLILTCSYVICHTRLYMVRQKDFIEAVERSICGRHLCDDVRAVAILIQHTLDSTDLPLYTAKLQQQHLVSFSAMGASLLSSFVTVQYLHSCICCTCLTIPLMGIRLQMHYIPRQGILQGQIYLLRKIIFCSAHTFIIKACKLSPVPQVFSQKKSRREHPAHPINLQTTTASCFWV